MEGAVAPFPAVGSGRGRWVGSGRENDSWSPLAGSVLATCQRSQAVSKLCSVHSVITLGTVGDGDRRTGFSKPEFDTVQISCSSLPLRDSACQCSTQKMLAHNLLKELSCDLGLLSCSQLHLVL